MNRSEKKTLDTSLKLIVKYSIIVFFGVVLSKIFTYVYRIIVARYFGAEVYGLLSLSLMVVGWFGAIATMGLTQGMLRFTPLYRGQNRPEKIRYIFKFSSYFLIFTGITSSVILFFLAEPISLTLFHNPSLTIFLKIFSLMIPFSLLSNIFLSTIQAFEKVAWYSFLQNIFQNIFKVIAVLALIFLGIGSTSVPLSYLLTIITLFIFSYFVCVKQIPVILGKIPDNNVRTKKDLISYSWPVMFYSIISSVYLWIDTLFIGIFQDATWVGFYNAAMPIAFLLTFAPQLFFQMFFPIITKEYGKRETGVVKGLSKQVNKWILILNIPIFSIIILFPGALINILFGPEFLPAENALRILSLGLLVYSMSTISNNLLSMAGKSRLLLINTIITGAINTILNIILIPKYGITGAAVATSITYVFLGILLISEAKHYIKIIPIKRSFPAIVIISLIPIGLLLLARSFVDINVFSLLTLGIFFGLVYLFLIFILGFLDGEDLMILSAIKNKIFNKLGQH